MKRILVVYFSHSGHTAFVAQQLARRCRADLLAINDPNPRTGVLGYVSSAVESLLGIQPPIGLDPCCLQEYDLVIVGTPVWFWNMSSPVRSFLTHYGSDCRQLAVFCTYGGSGQQRVLDGMERLWGRPVVARLALTDQQVTRRQHALALTRFVSEVKRWLQRSEVQLASPEAAEPRQLLPRHEASDLVGTVSP